MDITYIYFIYGLSFFSMGLVMWVESSRSPILAERRVLLPLAVFGFVHGSHEWLEMFLDKSNWLVVENATFWEWIRLGILVGSFASLIVFALQMIHPSWAFVGEKGFLWSAGLAVYIAIVILIGLLIWRHHGDLLVHLDVSARYLLAAPGALIAGIALHREANRVHQTSSATLRTALRLAAWGFVIYGFTQMIAPQTDTLPSKLINTTSFQMIVGFPIQVIRAAMAIVITLGLMIAARSNEEERQHQFLKLQKERLDAVLQLEQELKDRESMRRELMRHIVQAQEEERARIARELHDETSQVLTAFSLHLAALRQSLDDRSDITKQLDILRNLSRQMANGIYRLVHDLRPAQLDDLGLVAALQYLGDEAETQLGLKVRLEVVGDRRRLDPVVEAALYRIAQEALTNTARHAGVAEAQMRLDFSPPQVQLSISDQGCGFSMDQKRKEIWGLAGMQERAASIGGDFEVISAPGQGTTVRIFLPVMVEGKSDTEEKMLQGVPKNG